jgi:hypothetical protein
MPFIHRRGRLFLGREGATYGTGLGTALPGISNGPLSGLATATLGAQAGIPGIAIPTLTRELEPQFLKHQSPAQLGRRFEDVAQVPGRRQGGGQFQIEVMPDTFGLILLLALGSDSVAALASSTLSGAGNTANATTLTLAANSNPALADGQALWINDGALSEYVYVSGAVSANATSVPIRAGGGTGGGLKNGHANTTPIQVGPWTHTFTPSAGSPGTWQAEDNWGGAANSLLYKGLLLDSLELQAPIDNDTAALTALIKILGMAPGSAPVAASAAPSGIPLEEVAIGAGNSATLTATGATSPTIYVPDMKMTVMNTAKLAKSQVNSPDPAFAVGTNFSVRGTMETVFEEYGAFQDFAANTIWQNAILTYTWPNSLLKANPVQAAKLTITIQRFAIEKASKPTMKDEIVHYPIDAWRGQDYPDFTNPMTAVLINNVASY